MLNYTENAVNSLELMAQASKILSTNLMQNTAERALFARYAVHVVGDIHQPLHSVALYNRTYPSGDIGGNLEKIVLGNGTTSNFHSYWDAGAYILQNDTWAITRPMNLQNLTALKDVANQLIQQYGKEVETLAKIIDPLVWAQESFLIAQNTTYPHILTSNQATQAYNQQTYETSKKRITLAGYRLANYVIDLYKNAPGREQAAPVQGLVAEAVPMWRRDIPAIRNFLAEDSKKWRNYFRNFARINISSE